MATNVKTAAALLTGFSTVTLLAAGLSGLQMQLGNRFMQRGFAAPEYGSDGLYDQGKYAIGQVHLHSPYPTAPAAHGQQSFAAAGQGLHALQVPGWNNNGYHHLQLQQGTNAFNPYQKSGYAGYPLQNPHGFKQGAAHQLLQLQPGEPQNMQFGVHQQAAAATNFFGDRRLRIL